MKITDADVEDLYAGYDTKDGSVNLVVFSGPQLSLYELKTLSELFQGENFRKNLETVEELKRFAEERDGTIAQLAIA